AGATINVDAQDAGSSEINLSAGGIIMLEGGPGATVLSANALNINGDGGTINATAQSNVSIDAALSAASGQQGRGGNVSISTNSGTITVNAPINASGGEYGGGSIDIESDLDLLTASAAKLSVDGGGLSGNGGQVILDASVQGPVTVGGPISGTAASSNLLNG